MHLNPLRLADARAQSDRLAALMGGSGNRTVQCDSCDRIVPRDEAHIINHETFGDHCCCDGCWEAPRHV